MQAHTSGWHITVWLDRPKTLKAAEARERGELNVSPFVTNLYFTDIIDIIFHPNDWTVAQTAILGMIAVFEVLMCCVIPWLLYNFDWLDWLSFLQDFGKRAWQYFSSLNDLKAGRSKRKLKKGVWDSSKVAVLQRMQAEWEWCAGIDKVTGRHYDLESLQATFIFMVGGQPQEPGLGLEAGSGVPKEVLIGGRQRRKLWMIGVRNTGLLVQSGSVSAGSGFEAISYKVEHLQASEMQYVNYGNNHSGTRQDAYILKNDRDIMRWYSLWNLGHICSYKDD